MEISSLAGGISEVYGRVKVIFDCFGFEFEHECWVIDIGLPLEMQLGNDWLREHRVQFVFPPGGMDIPTANARRLERGVINM